MDIIPPEALLDSYPPATRDAAEALRAIVRRTVPEAIERVRIGWRLIGYDMPVGWRSIYFAYVAPEVEHVHLGFEWGAFMRDPAGLLQGAGITKQVRWLTVTSRAQIDEAAFTDLVREAVRVAGLTRSERFGLAVEREEPAPKP